MWYPILIGALCAYFLGNLNGAVNISHLMAHEDVRAHGSGNAGLTNFARNYGGWGTALVLVVDGGKAVLACLLGGLLLAPYGLELEGRMLGAVAVSLGHDFPALLGFKGGKGIVCGFAAAMITDWRIGLMLLALFALFYFTTWLVSLSSVAGAVGFIAGFIWLHHDRPWVLAGGIFMGLLALFMHRENLKRLVKGEEKKTSLFHKEDKS